MLAAIREMAEKKDECTKQTHVCTAEYLEACNLIFENGILSHEMICSPNSKALVYISEGMKWFLKWKEELQKQPGKKSHPLRCPRPFLVEDWDKPHTCAQTSHVVTTLHALNLTYIIIAIFNSLCIRFTRYCVTQMLNLKAHSKKCSLLGRYV